MMTVMMKFRMFCMVTHLVLRSNSIMVNETIFGSGQNSLGKCDCEGQLFIGPNCTEGFYCTKHTNDSILYDGCVTRCRDPNNEILVKITAFHFLLTFNV